MLRNFPQKQNSDRFILSRSAERDRQVDKYKIEDITKTYNIKQILNQANKSQLKPRTPSIISDENALNQKMYLNLLKSQIFENKTNKKTKTKDNSSSKCLSKKRNLSTIQKRNITYKQNNKNNLTIVKNLNEAFFNEISSNHNSSNTFNPINDLTNNYSNLNRSNNFLSKKLFNEGTKSFSSFLNLDLDDNESTLNFIKQKKIPKTAYKVLEAPNLREDFYLNLLDWSKQDILAVGLDSILYAWNGSNMSVSQISTLNTIECDYYSSLAWTKDASKLIVGTNNGTIEIFDAETQKKISTINAIPERIDIIAPMNISYNIFSFGSQDSAIKTYDMRQATKEISSMNGHRQEVCGLKWSPDDRRLASGGNDNKLIIWNISKSDPEQKLSGHTSAVKAIDWSPFRFGYLLSGGGSDDRTIKLWNINTMTLVDSIDTSSQVCNVAFSKNSKEFVSTHGYSENYILVWDFDKMDVKATLKGHKGRVVYMSLGPDSKKIVTGAGDETLRFWEVFNQDKNNCSDIFNLNSKYNQDKDNENIFRSANNMTNNIFSIGNNLNIR